MYKRILYSTFSLISLITLSLPVLAQAIEPDTVEVFIATSQLNEVVDVKINAKGLSIIYVDNVINIENGLNESIPKFDEREYKTRKAYESAMIEKANAWTLDHAQELKESWNNIYKSIGYGIEKTPAIVINSEYVVYGETVSKAVKKWKTYISNKNKRVDYVN